MARYTCTPVVEDLRDQIVAQCVSGRVDPAFFSELTVRLRRLIAFDASFFVATDPETILPVPPVRLENVEGESCRSFWERELLVEDFLAYRALARAELPVGTLQAATEGHPARSVRHEELHRPNGLSDELRVAFRLDGLCWGVASLWRQEGRPPFGQPEIEAVASLVRPIGRAFRNAATTPADGLQRSPTGPGMMTFSASGTLLSHNAEASVWLSEVLEGHDSSREHGLAIPSEVYSVISQARAIAAGRAGGVAMARVRSRSGRWLALHGSCLQQFGVGQEPGQVAVVVGPAKASEIAPLIVKAYELSDREQAVTRLIAQGVATREVATLLHLSIHTVRDHIKAIFEKVGVSSRGELVARVFADHYHTAFHG